MLGFQIQYQPMHGHDSFPISGPTMLRELQLEASL